MKVCRMFSALIGMTVGAVVGAAVMSIYKGKIINSTQGEADKFRCLFRMLNHWLEAKQNNKEIVTFFNENNYRRIAIYGMSRAGERLYDELKNTNIEVAYAIDKRAEDICVDVEVYSIDEHLPSVDAIVVTAITSYEEIRDTLSEYTSAPIISLDDIIYDM